MAEEGFVVAVVGATGAVGQEMLSVLSERKFPVSEVRPLASSRSAGSKVSFGGEDLVVRELKAGAFEGVDIALFSAGGAISEVHAPLAAEAGAVAIDNTSFFRQHPEVPLVVPEVNPHAIAGHGGIIANPNCSTIQLVVALQPLRALAGLKRLVVSTYQAASGAGREAMDELRDQAVALLNFREPPVKAFPRRLAFDVIPQIDRFLEDGRTKEERKMVDESRKIFEQPDLAVSVTCVRVPVFVGHCLSVNAEFEGPIELEAARRALSEAPGVCIDEDPELYPVAADVAGQDDTWVGRLRADPCHPNTLDLWVAADNLRKGAATNAVQIAEHLVASGALVRDETPN